MFVLMYSMSRVSNSEWFKTYSLNELKKGVLVISFRLESASVIMAFNSRALIRNLVGVNKQD